MAKRYCCLSCGRDTTNKTRFCHDCDGEDRPESPSAFGPWTELDDEDHDYSEEAIGPHVSDERWGWAYAQDPDGSLLTHEEEVDGVASDDSEDD